MELWCGSICWWFAFRMCHCRARISPPPMAEPPWLSSSWMHGLSGASSKTSISLDCDCWRQIANGIREWVSTMSRNVRGVLSFLTLVAGPRSRVARILKTCTKFAWQMFSPNSHRFLADVSNPTWTLLSVVSVSQKVLGMWDNFALCRLATFETTLWLIVDTNANLTARHAWTALEPRGKLTKLLINCE